MQWLVRSKTRRPAWRNSWRTSTKSLQPRNRFQCSLKELMGN